ncbi:unnamed protein product [Rhizophagus irregularis]|nr:unnamed protein product [Rhizophagus irregularis]
MNIIEIKTLPLKLEPYELDSTAFPSLFVPSVSLDMTFRFFCFSLEWVSVTHRNGVRNINFYGQRTC